MVKRILCLLLCTVLLVSFGGVQAFAMTFADVPQTSDYYEEIDVLSNFGIILGDAGSNNFRPNSHISREEFSVIITRILGVSNLMPDLTVLPFLDVTPETCDEWSLAATKVAYDMGIIGGYGDGNFGPKDAVTYEQVVKMLVCALGYEKDAIENGGWPDGYLKVANNLGITQNAVMDTKGFATRGIVAKLLYNSLEVDLMEKVADGKYEVRTGKNILTDKLGYIYAEGVVTGVSGKAFTHAGKRIDEKSVEIDGELMLLGNSNANEYFGQLGSYYYKEKGNVKTLVSFTPNARNVLYTAETDLIEEIDDSGITFYKDNKATKTESFTFDANKTVYLYNGRTASLSDIARPNIGNVQMIDNNGDELIDVVMIDDARVFVVSSVDNTNKIVFNKYDQSERLVLNENEADIRITRDNAEVTLASLKKDDVLLVRESSVGGYPNITVLVVTKTAAGAVTSVAGNGKTFSIENKAYGATDAYLDYIEANPSESLAVGDKVTVYLNDNNEILYSVRTALNASIGYITAVGVDDDEELVQVKMFTSAGSMKIFDCDTHLSINGEVYDWDEVEDVLKQSNSLTNTDEGVLRADTAQLVKYTTTTAGKIDSIITMVAGGDKTRELVLGKPYTAGTESTYYSATRSFKDTNVVLSTSTKIFFVPTDRSNDNNYAVKTYSALTNNNAYKIEAYDQSTTGVADYLIIYASDTAQITWSNPALITAADYVQNSSGATVYSVNFIMNGKTVTRQTKSRNVYSGCKAGDIVRYATDASGVIVEIDKIFDPENTDLTLQNKGAEGKRYYAKSPVYSDTNAYYLTVCGTVYSRDDERLVLSLGDVNTDGDLEDTDGNLNEQTPLYTFAFSSGTTYFVYDNTSSKDKLNTEVTKDYIADWLNTGKGASRIMLYANYTNLRFVYIIIE